MNFFKLCGGRWHSVLLERASNSRHWKVTEGNALGHHVGVLHASGRTGTASSESHGYVVEYCCGRHITIMLFIQLSQSTVDIHQFSHAENEPCQGQHRTKHWGGLGKPAAAIPWWSLGLGCALGLSHPLIVCRVRGYNLLVHRLPHTEG